MKILNWILRIVLILILAIPVVGALGVFPAPTADMYNSAEAFAFIDTVTESGYITHIMALVFAAAIVLTLMNRMALVALLILPITVNIVGFHAFLDGGLFTAGAVMGNVLGLLNLYFLWKNREAYRSLLVKSN